ncbi:hypothetical protein J1N10_09040 [Carboxylicivirga sp. A043]|uniref:hypothetical protein n=1 Tax=Carboxylicivirga litoralis TaxID=2816963 RepID=UPI0021CB8423|nr:hypothetical protein [Carboxylicivirga sp. A043]MCU4156123.1 hypothetical protein [Carboxylicivirga sp. A043]
MKNNHSESIPKDVIEAAITKLTEVKSALAPYSTTLTKDERRALPKMGEKTLAFVTNSHDYSTQYPELMPSFAKQEDFDIDVADATGLLPVEGLLNELASQINDTAMLAGSEAYNTALLFYNNVKLAAKNNVPGAKEVYDDLKTRFPSTRRKVNIEE